MKYPRYQAYKPSGIPWLSEIPAHWAEKRFRFVAEINPVKSGVNYLPEDTLVSFVPMEAVGEYGGLVLESEKQIADVKAGYTYFADGDVVLAKITPCFENGKGALAEGLLNGIAFGTTELHVVRTGKELDRRFLFYLTMSHPFRKIGEAMMYGAGGQKRVPEDFIKDFRPGLPPLDEQAAIAAFLDRKTARIDTLIEKKRRFIELLQEKRSALISHAVTRGLNPDVPLKDSGIEWLGRIPAHWDIAPIWTRYEVMLGKMLDEKRITGNQLAPYLRNVDVQWDRINICDLPEMDFSSEDRQRCSLKNGDLLVCEGGEIGRAAVWKSEIEECYFQKALHRLRPIKPAKDEPRYMFYILRWAAKSAIFSANGNPNTIEHLTADKLKKHRFAYPPITEQTSIAKYLDQESTRIDALRTKVESAIDRLKEYRAALISAAVTGKIDVREAA